MPRPSSTIWPSTSSPAAAVQTGSGSKMPRTRSPARRRETLSRSNDDGHIERTRRESVSSPREIPFLRRPPSHRQLLDSRKAVLLPPHGGVVLDRGLEQLEVAVGGVGGAPLPG